MKKESNIHKREVMNEQTGVFNEIKDKESGATTQDGVKLKEEVSPFNKNFVLICTHFNAILYSMCFWIQLGVLPYLSKKLGADPVVFGYLQTTFAVVQLCGGPIFGRFGDIFGSRAALALAFCAAAMSYGILGISSTVTMLFLSRLPSVFMHSMQGAQMIVTDISTDSERSNALGKLGVSYAIESPKSSESVFDMKKILELLKIPTVLYLIILKVFTAIPFGVFQSMFAVVSMDYFKLDPQHNGFVLSYAGTLSILVQGFGVGYLTKRFNETDLLKCSIISIAFAYALMFMVTDIYQFCAVLVPLVTGGTILTVVTTSALTKAVTIKDTGAVLGLSMACNSLVRSLSPTLGGYLFKIYGWPVFGVFGFVINSVIVLYLLVFGRENLHH
ncbi:hypothetical protein QZH41_019830 [Actinostola sp. cb2023]|nr:hypothetical protein QZH41_019830 [Actinostola sp. cb2023]